MHCSIYLFSVKSNIAICPCCQCCQIGPDFPAQSGNPPAQPPRSTPPLNLATLRAAARVAKLSGEIGSNLATLATPCCPWLQVCYVHVVIPNVSQESCLTHRQIRRGWCCWPWTEGMPRVGSKGVLLFYHYYFVFHIVCFVCFIVCS